jgi:hypothetical protein
MSITENIDKCPTQARRLGVWLCSVCLLGSISFNALSGPIVDHPAESFIVAGLVNRLVSDVAHEWYNFNYIFQKAFRVESHQTAPELKMHSGSAGDCIPFLSVSIDPENIAKKWDGSPDPDAFGAASLLLDLRFAQENGTRIMHDNDGLDIKLVFKSPLPKLGPPGQEMNPPGWEFVKTRFQYGSSQNWEQSRYGKDTLPGRIKNPFLNLFTLMRPAETGGDFVNQWVYTWFRIKEEQRDLAVQYLKSIFAKCH